MQPLIQIAEGDRKLLGEVAAAMAEAARRSGEWLVCRPGCTQCCMGPFSITGLDALRLRNGMMALESTEPARAAAVRQRAAAYVAAIAMQYPGDPVTGELQDEDSLPESMDEVACPALDPNTGWCDLYQDRPITCRAFGPATMIGEGRVGACELCYAGATDEEVARCAVDVDPEGIEAGLVAALAEAGVKGLTIVAYALAP
jgi:Fe-S-cluster containining protein